MPSWSRRRASYPIRTPKSSARTAKSKSPNALLAAPASQDRHIELGDMQRALMHLPQPQREALILVGAGGFAYEEAAEICGCAVGTIKSRVARGRVALEQLLSSGKLPSRRQHKTDPDKSALQTIMGEVDSLSRDHE